MKYVTTNAYYFAHLNAIGGIESHLYYIGKKYGYGGANLDITVFYRTADNVQLQRIKRHLKCIELKQEDNVECENLFCCFNRDILDHCKAKNKYLVLHGDYKDMVERGQLNKNNLPIDKRIDKYLGVSKLVCKSWEEVTGIKADVIGEPVALDEIEKPLLFISATRLTKEKGYERMRTLANVLNDNQVNYLWLVYTNEKKKDIPRNMVFLPQRLDITDKLNMADAYIQLSDNEGYCLSIVEALCRDVPIISTKLPVLKELGLNKDNSILLDFDMNNIPVEEIRNVHEKKAILKELPKYKQPVEKWQEYLINTPSDYMPIRVKATENYQKTNMIDKYLGFIPGANYEWVVDEKRYQEILDYENKTNIKYVVKV